MTSSAWALKAAIKAALEADASLISLMGNPPPVHDRVPRGALMPYLAFGEWRTEESDTDDTRIDRHIFMIEVWSSYAGLKEVKAIAAAVETTLHGASFSLTAHALVDLSFIGAAFGLDEKENLSEAALRFRALTQENE